MINKKILGLIGLAARLTNWKIDIKSETQFREMLMQKQEQTEETTEEAE